ncbi:fungal-specific transcription factor domain-containing protein [Penicillium chermesinum]|uniref:Fungal-specific transcription factor domain-containing protein n=1 Tax=Penicillium chermesinum TaxID=63820 RepID=A0A9W9PJL4_9EURO|nr:fungal-specific transcription factor domain-containing protein [Penicillium chermesinum]KAJ5247307.1 fungal-specific transcription factor domain-containing protein [Penicillium chermesinum]
MGNLGAACLTCRQKSRRCDRARPACKRCIGKGLECLGYPDKFRFCGVASRGKWKNRVQPVDPDEPPATLETSIPASSESRPPEATSSAPRPPDGNEAILASKEAKRLLSHYDKIICPHQIAQFVDDGENPYRLYVLPLARKQKGLLCAVLALSACHLGHLISDSSLRESVSLSYRAKAIAELGVSIGRVGTEAFTENDRDAVFATIQILLLHDICESGISSHGAHISGAMSICSQLMLDQRLTVSDERTVFFLGNLVWLDIVRAFSAPQRLCFPQQLRHKILSLCDLRFEAVNGCPRALVLIIGNVLNSAKKHLAGDSPAEEYAYNLKSLLDKLYQWDGSRSVYPDTNPLWLSNPPDEPHIQASVCAILDAVANVPGSSPLVELLVLPLFMSGADCLSRHSQHYIQLRFSDIKVRSEMVGGITAPQVLLDKVWEAREQQADHERENIPWMQFTQRADSAHHDDYLII